MTHDLLTNQTLHPQSFTKIKWSLLVIVFSLLAGVIYFFNLEGERTVGSHEGYAVVPAGEMLRTGNWVVPMFGGLPRLQKPPLLYWVVATSSALWGEADQINITAARLPAVFSAIALAIFMGYWAYRWYGKAAGLGALFVQLTSLYMMTYGRKAEVDMLNLLLMTVAMFLIFESSPSDSRKRYHLRWIGIFALLSLTWLAKFHYGLTLVVVPCFLFYCVQRRYKELLNFAHPIGLLLLAAAIFIWGYLVTQRLPEALTIWNHELVDRATGKLNDSNYHVWFYLPFLFLLTLPWTPFVYAAVPRSLWRAWKRKDEKERFLWIWFLVHLAIVSLQPVKHQNYIIAALPVCSLWAGQTFAVIAARVHDGKPFLNRQWAYFWSIVFLITPALLAFISIPYYPFVVTPILVISISFACFSFASVWLFYRKQHVWGTGFITVALLVVQIGATGWIIPKSDHRLPVVHFVQNVRTSLPPEENICLFRLGQEAMFFYLPKPAFRIEHPQALQTKLLQQQRLFVITTEYRLSQLSDIGHVDILKRITTPPGMPKPRYHHHKKLLLVELMTPQFAQQKKTLSPVIRQATGNINSVKQ